MGVSITLGNQLKSLLRDSTIKILGYDLLKNDAEAKLLIAIIKAYGKSAAGFIYASPSRARSTLRPPDVVLCHPDVGLLIIECKSHSIGAIQGVEAGSIMVRYEGRIKPENAIRQAEDQMFAIDNDIVKLVRDRRSKPLTNCMVAFPNLSEADWVSKGYDKAHPGSQLLFQEQINDIGRLKQRVNYLVKEGLQASHKSTPLNIEQSDVIFKVFGNSDVINDSRPPRSWTEKNSLGSEIDEMVALDKYLSEEQKEYSRLSIGKYPRVIRGVAGSGKSIVLANLVAGFLHRKLNSLDSETSEIPANVAVTCFNQALVSFLKKKVRTAYREQTLNEDIPTSTLLTTHLNDLIWKMIKEYGWPLEYIRVKDVEDGSQRATLYRQQIEEFAATQPDYYKSLCFDVIFVDEGQDIEPEEYRLLLDLIKPSTSGEKPLIIFYDDAQNLYGRSRPVWQEIGINVAVGDRSRVMRECFRNTRQIVELAFNVLLGSQASSEVRVQTRTYADVSYLKSQNLLQEVGDHFRINFTEREYRKPEVKVFPQRQSEIDWIAFEINRLISVEQVRMEDILILFYRPNNFDHKQLENAILQYLPSVKFIEPFGQSRENKQQYIFQEGCLTLSTVYGAKGYDAPIVFVAGTDSFSMDKEGRAAFYVAATRSKLILYVTGIHSSNSTLLDEAQKVLHVI